MMLGLSAGNRWVTNVSGWEEDGGGDVSMKESSGPSFSGSSRAVISCKRDGPAISIVSEAYKDVDVTGELEGKKGNRMWGA